MNFKQIDIKKIKKIASWTILSFLILIFIFVLFPLLPIKNNYSLKMVLSGSMEPAIKTGSVIMVKPVSNYQIGNVITYQRGKRTRDITTHRIVGQKNDEFITQGDNNNAIDMYPVKKEQILGKVIFDIPFVGYIANFAHSKTGFILLIVVPAISIITSEGLKISKEIKKKKTKKT